MQPVICQPNNKSMKHLLLLLLITAFCSINAFSQQAAVLAAFEKYHIDTAVLNPDMGLNALHYRYDLKREVNTEGNYKVYLSNYDPAKTGLECWTLQSVNGKAPSKAELKNFDKEHKYIPAYTIDKASLTIISDDGQTLHIGYKYTAASVDADHSFLKDCTFTAVIKTSTGRLESTAQKNLKDVKIKIVKAVKLEGTTHYIYDEQDKKYLISTAEVVAVVKVLGQQLAIVTTDSYTYKR